MKNLKGLIQHKIYPDFTIKKILLIEDDKMLAEMYRDKFSEVGFKVILAFEAEKGLELAKKERPDLILLDIILPGIDGFEALSRLKKNQDLAEIPVIILSNLGRKEDVARALGLGVAHYLIKAYYTPKEVVEKVTTCLRGS